MHQTVGSWFASLSVLLTLASAGIHAQAQVTLRAGLERLESFQTCIFTAAHADGAPRLWEWSIREEDGGGFTRMRRGPGNLYRAPQVDQEQIFHIQVQVQGHPEQAAEATIRVVPSPIPILAPTGSLEAGKGCRLDVQPRDGQARAFTWSVQEADGGTFTDLGLMKVTYHAPLAVERRTVHICATDSRSGDRSVVPMVIGPKTTGLAARDLVFAADGGLIGRVQGPDWLAPELGRFREAQPLEARPDSLSGFAFPRYPASPVLGIHWVADPAMGALNGRWLVNDHEGLLTVSRSGAWERLALRIRKSPTDVEGEPLPTTACTAVAVRPPGSDRHNPRHVVVALRLEEGPHYELFELTPDGMLTPLKVTRHRDYFPKATDIHHSAGALIHRHDELAWNWSIDAMAMDTTGNLFVAKGGRRDGLGSASEEQGGSWVERISTFGVKSLVAGLPRGLQFEYDMAAQGHADLLGSGYRRTLARDGHGVEARFARIRGLAVASGEKQLYVTDGDALRVVTPSGEVRTLLGKTEGAGFAPAPPPGPAVPPGRACLNRPDGLVLDQGILFIADQDNHAVRAYNPRTGELRTVLGDPGQGILRYGPLGCFAPDNLPEECAALAEPTALGLAPGADGVTSLRVVHLDGIARLDLPPGCFGASHYVPAGATAPAAPHHGPAGAVAPDAPRRSPGGAAAPPAPRP